MKYIHLQQAYTSRMFFFYFSSPKGTRVELIVCAKECCLVRHHLVCDDIAECGGCFPRLAPFGSRRPRNRLSSGADVLVRPSVCFHQALSDHLSLGVYMSQGFRATPGGRSVWAQALELMKQTEKPRSRAG
jgi:hypothetical protein